MFGCFRQIGCLVVLLVAGAGGWWWWTHNGPTGGPSASTAGEWRPVTAADAASGERAVTALARRGGPAYANLTPSQAVAYLVESSAKGLPPSATDVQAMVNGDTLNVVAVVPLRDLGGSKLLGPFGGALGNRDTVHLSGRTDLVRPGMAELHVTRARVGGLNLPSAVIPRVVHAIRRDTVTGLAGDALALPLPPYIGDVRIANGRVTLYKNTQ